MRVCVELKFDRQYSAVFSRKYIKIKIEFEKPYLLCVCCVFIAFPSFWRPFWSIFCLTVDATACYVLKTVKQKIAQNGLQKLGKVIKTQQTHNRKGFSNFSLILMFFFSAENRRLFPIEFQLHTNSHITLWLPVLVCHQSVTRFSHGLITIPEFTCCIYSLAF